MNGTPTGPAASPPWRLLAALAAMVLAIHVLVLQASPVRLGLNANAGALASKAFSTRSIEAAPAPAAPAPPARPARPQPAPKPPPKPAPAPEIQLNSDIALADTALPAIDSIAPETSIENSQASAGTPTNADPASAASTPAPIRPASSAQASSAAQPAGPPTTPVTAIALPESVTLEYTMTGASKGLTYHASAELGWNNTGSQYNAVMKVSAMFLGSRSMTSVGRVTPTGLAPTRFADKFRSEQAAHFDADKGKITFSANTPDAVWIEGAQDRVSVFMQLGGMLAARPGDFAPGSEITLYTIGPREADSWTFTVEAEEKVNLPHAEITAVKLTRKPRREYDQKVEVWYAPSLGYLPVRNRITQHNGDFIDQQLSKLIRP